METMYDDGEIQGLQGLQDQMLAQGRDEYSADGGMTGIPEESSMMNMASDFTSWQNQGYSSMDENSSSEQVINGGVNNQASANGEDGNARDAPKRKLAEVETIEEDNNKGDKAEDNNGQVNNEEDGPSPAKKTNTESSGKDLHPELEKLWKPVEENPGDFTSWTYLLQYVDHENELVPARDAYDKFFARYPYCYGYWKKYADLEKRQGSSEECLKVFKRGLQAIPLSVDLWIHYLNYIKATHEKEPDVIREHFQNAVKTVGMEFRSDKLWEHYLQYEKDNGDLRRVVGIYDQLLAVPTQSHAQHFEKFKELVNESNPADLVGEEEYIDLKALVEDTVSNAAEEERESVEQSAIREKILEKRSGVYKKTEAEAQARWSYEEAIKRPYFHVKPLEKGQLKIWKEYLDFEIERGDEKRILILFERCLIACCLYEEYWIKYIKYLQTQKTANVERLRDVLARACTVHHPNKPWINLHWAAFEESQGQATKAVEILENLKKVMPNSAHVYFRLINLHRRQGDIPRCVELFEEYLKEQKDSSAAALIKIKYARFLAKVSNDYERAVKLLQQAFDDHESSRVKTAMALVELGMDREPVDLELVVSSFDKALAADIPVEDKATLAHRKVEFLDDYGADVKRLQKAYEELQTFSSGARQKNANSTKPEQETSAPKYPKAVAGTYPTPAAPQYNHNTPSGTNAVSDNTSATTAAVSGGQDYSSQYSQYPGWNYPGQPGYTYPPQPQNWNTYGGYHG